MNPHTRTRLLGAGTDLVLLLVSALMLLPLLLLVSNAFKTPPDILRWPPSVFPREFTMDNVIAVLATTPLLRWVFNSVFFAILSSAAVVATSAVSGYVLAKFRTRSLDAVFGVILATAIVPFEVYMIPLYFNVQKLGLLNTTAGLLIGYLVMSFGIFLIRQNVLAAIPDDLLDAARVDGASEPWIFLRIVLPLLRGPLGALGVLAFFNAWTAFSWPMIVATTKTSYTVEVGLALFQTGFTVDLGSVSAASAIVLVPSVLIFSLLRRNFVQGVQTSGLKD